MRVVKVVGFVATTPDFTGQPGVVNGATELIGEVFGEAGRTHGRRSASRTATGFPGRGRADRGGLMPWSASGPAAVLGGRRAFVEGSPLAGGGA